MTESFDDATAFARAVVADCDAPILDRLQKAHDHEMEQLRRSRFHEGYEAGQRSMDAKHYQLKLRLQGLKFGDGSHENLSRLAYAIYPCPTGWGKESCEGLRDKIIDMLGGVHDGSSAPSPTACGACDDACARDNGDETAVESDRLRMSHGYDPNAPLGKCTIDRINNDGNYEPTNCRWVDMKVQRKNQRKS